MGEQPFCEKGYCQRNLWLEPRLGQPRGAPTRAERRGFVGRKSAGRALRGHGKNWCCCRKSDFGGPGGIRTPEDSRHVVYSHAQLTTLVPTHFHFILQPTECFKPFQVLGIVRTHLLKESYNICFLCQINSICT